ncbi:MAG: hypothetical protein ACLFTK_01955 [Anaerolineales bacterium]
MADDFSPQQLAKMSTQELLSLSNQMKERIRNADWQRVVADLQNSGHIHTFHDSAPPLLQRFLKLEIDLDAELERQSLNAPLMSSIALDPKRPRGERRQVATLTSQDGGAQMQFEVYPTYNTTLVAFTIKNMLTMRFNLAEVNLDERAIFLELMRREEGMTILWTPERWEQDYLIFTRRQLFTRVYAFSPHFEAKARLTSESTGALVDWLERSWFPRSKERRRKRNTQQMLAMVPEDKLGLPDVEATLLHGPSSEDEPLLHVIKILNEMAMLPPEQRDTLRQRVSEEDKILVNRIYRVLDQHNDDKNNLLRMELEPQIEALDRVWAKIQVLRNPTKAQPPAPSTSNKADPTGAPAQAHARDTDLTPPAALSDAQANKTADAETASDDVNEETPEEQATEDSNLTW